ncbi:MAG: AMP-binding protein [Candidatus Hydrothermales bacterium]
MKKIADIFLRGCHISKDNMFSRIRRGDTFQVFLYSEALEMVESIGGYLKSKGFKRGDRAAVLGENMPEWGISYLGIQWAGGVCVPLDARASSSDWEHFLRHSESKFIFVSKRFVEDILEIKDKVESLVEIISFPDSDGKVTSFQDVILHKEKLEVPVDRDPTDLAVILYTSGTTGTPKGIMLSHKNIISNIESVLKIFDFNENDHLFSVLPIHHVFEGTCGFLAPLYVGAKITYARSLKPSELLEDLRDTEPTVFLTVPLLLEKLYLGIMKNINSLSLPKKSLFKAMSSLSNLLDPLTGKKSSKILFKTIRERMGFGKIKYIISGGAALPTWVGVGLQRLGFPIYQGYGLSETAPVVSVNPPKGKNKISSVGPPIPGVEVKIIDPDENGIGEIAVKGDNVMLGYYKDKKATERAFKEGWFLTGDLGYIDKDGYIYITGRKKSVIVTKGGKNIYPEEIEEKLLESPIIKECLVLAKIHPKTKTEILHAIIYPDYEEIDNRAKQMNVDVTEDLLNDWIGKEIEEVNKKLADYKRIRSFSLRDEEFPKTTTQKIKRYLFEEGGIEI